MESRISLKVISRCTCDWDAYRSQIVPSQNPGGREVFKSAYFGVMYISWHSGWMALLDIFQQSQTCWSQEPHHALEGISGLTLRKSNPGFHSTTKRFRIGGTIQLSRDVLKQLWTEGKLLCHYLVHKPPHLEVIVQSLAVKRSGGQGVLQCPCLLT